MTSPINAPGGCASCDDQGCRTCTPDLTHTVAVNGSETHVDLDAEIDIFNGAGESEFGARHITVRDLVTAFKAKGGAR